MEQVISTVIFILSVLAGLLILTFLVVIHELGHAIVARRNGVVVEEFGIGFPPRAAAKKLKNGILLTINWLPLGGFVKLKGEHDEDGGKGSYGGASLWAKAKILLAGVGINWLAAAVIFMLISLFGVPKILPNQFSVPGDTIVNNGSVVAATVVDQGPAAKSGLQKGDEIIRLGTTDISDSQTLTNVAKEAAGKTLPLTYKRDGIQKTTEVTLNSPDKAQRGYIGVSASQQTTLRSTWSAPIVGLGLTAQLSYETVKGLGVLLGQVGQGIASKFSGDQSAKTSGDTALAEADKSVAGPIGILFNLFPTFLQAGIIPLLLLTAIISLTLAIMNVLPIPALDGGRLFLTLLFRGLKKPLTKDREEKIVGYSFYGLILLVIFISVLDVRKFFN